MSTFFKIFFSDKKQKKGHNHITVTMSPSWTFKIKSFCLF
nr:MAG TPA: hypothetical protein [Caudoviricetes sp.]